jgi:hypothetical protein
VTRDDPRLPADALTCFAEAFLAALGCSAPVAAEVADHLVEADLMGVYSHGTMRLPQYLDWARADMFDPAGEPCLKAVAANAPLVDGANGFGMPAMRLATGEGVRRARAGGVSAIGVVNVGHTGRIGAFAEQAARAGCLAVIFGGGRRRDWRSRYSRRRSRAGGAGLRHRRRGGRQDLRGALFRAAVARGLVHRCRRQSDDRSAGLL